MPDRQKVPFLQKVTCLRGVKAWQLSLRVILLRCLLVVGLLVPATQAFAATSAEREAFASAFRSAMGDVALYDTLIDGMNIGPEKTPLFRRYFQEVMTDPAMQQRMIDGMLATGLLDVIIASGDEEEAMRTGFSLGYEVAVSITTRGLAKMSHDDIRSFFTLMGQAFAQVEARYCRVLMQQQGATQEAQILASFAVMRSLDLPQFRSYLSLSKAALAAELSSVVPRGLPTPAQMDLSNQDFVMKFEAALQELDDPRAVVMSLSEPHSAADEDFCVAGALLFTVLAGMDGLTGQWMRLATLAAAQ